MEDEIKTEVSEVTFEPLPEITSEADVPESLLEEVSNGKEEG